MCQVVPISQVIPLSDSSSPYAVRRIKSVLQNQGQIEPLQVHSFNSDGSEYYVVFHDDAWGNEIVFAARELRWDTLLIVVSDKYVQ